MATEVEHPPLAPGLHVQHVDVPLKRASHLAAELDGVLCATLPQVDELLAGLAAVPDVDDGEVGGLHQLIDRLAAAQRIVDATLDRAAATVGERLASTGSGLAVHPAAVRDRATAVLDARAALAAAEAVVGAVEAETAARTSSPAEEPSDVAPAPSTPSAPRRRRRWFDWLRRSPEDDHDGEQEASDLLQQVSDATDEAFGARRALEALHDRATLTRAQRDRAVEDLRVAERAWRDLAGDDPVEDAEAVVRRFDPQHQDALDLARGTPSARATSRLLDDAQRSWTEAWAPAAAPPFDLGHEALDELVARARRPVVLVEVATGRAEEVALAAPRAAVVVLEAAEEPAS